VVKVCEWLAAGRCFFFFRVSCTHKNKIDRHDTVLQTYGCFFILAFKYNETDTSLRTKMHFTNNKTYLQLSISISSRILALTSFAISVVKKKKKTHQSWTNKFWQTTSCSVVLERHKCVESKPQLPNFRIYFREAERELFIPRA